MPDHSVDRKSPADLLRSSAFAPLQRAVALRPGDANGYGMLALALGNAGHDAAALTAFLRAGRIEPEEPCHLHYRCRALINLGRHAQAVDLQRRALAIHPDDPDAFLILGMALVALGRVPEAAAAYLRATRLAPDFCDAQNRLGNALMRLDRHEDAVVVYRNSIVVEPGEGMLWCNQGLALQQMARFPDAERTFRRALAADAAAVDRPFNLGLLLLMKGEFPEGWRHYEARPARAEMDARHLPGPLWEGEPPMGMRLLLHAEQGAGDVIQMLRYVPLLAARGATVILEVPKPLLRLATSVAGAAEVVEPGQRLPAFDRRCPMMSLPRLMGTDTVAAIPAGAPYLSVPADAVRRWANALGRDGRLTVGLAWAGNPVHSNDRARSVAADRVLPLLDVEGVTFILMQKEPRPADEDRLLAAGRCHSLGPLLGDFADTAALLSALDLVITVDTAVAHLAGALGRPVWTMIPFAPDWRWLLEREDSPWYPTMRLYRQAKRGDWDGVIARVREDVSALVRQGRRG